MREDAERFIALRLLSRDPGISPEVYSVSSRLLLSLFLHLSRLPPSLISKDLTFHSELSSKLQNACVELASTKSVTLGRTLPLLLNLLDQRVKVVFPIPAGGRSDDAPSRLTEILVLWIFYYTQGYLRWSGHYHLWRTFRCSKSRRVRWNGNYGRCLA